MTQRFAPTHGMTPTPTGQYILASDAEEFQRALADVLSTAGAYLDMVERGEITAAAARNALEVGAKLSMSLMTEDSKDPNLAYLIQKEGDWTVRLDSPHGPKDYHKRHVHIEKRGLAGAYSWNIDGTRHDRHRFPASEKCIEAAKDKAARVLRVPVDSLEFVVSERGPLRVSARTGRHGSRRMGPRLELRVRSSDVLIVLGAPSGLVFVTVHDAPPSEAASRGNGTLVGGERPRGQ